MGLAGARYDPASTVLTIYRLRRAGAAKSGSEAVTRRKSAVGIAGTFVGGARAVAFEHLAGAPSGPAHQVGFAAVVRKP
jgi:hypothetical protein